MPGQLSFRSDRIIDFIVEQLTNGEPLAKILREQVPGMPKVTTWYDWCNEDPELAERVARAREHGADKIAADCLVIADTPQEGKIVRETKDGTFETIEDMLGHRKLQIETRLKLLRCWDPKRYGDRLDLNQTGNITYNITTRRMTPSPPPADADPAGGDNTDR